MSNYSPVAIVTGASTGIGLAISKKFAQKGFTVVMVARTPSVLEAAAKDIANSFPFAGDMRQATDRQKLIQMVMEKFGQIDVLINNAAQGMFAKVEQIHLDNYRELVELNVYAPLALMQAVIPHMRQQKGGSIINISSQASKKYIPNIAGYASTKYALNALSLTARAELAADNITVSIVCPGVVDTDFGQHADFPEPDALRHTPDGSLHPHVLKPEVVADKVWEVWLSKEAEIDVVS